MIFSECICYRLSVRLSVVRLSVMLVHPTQVVEIFGNISTASIDIHECNLQVL